MITIRQHPVFAGMSRWQAIRYAHQTRRFSREVPLSGIKIPKSEAGFSFIVGFHYMTAVNVNFYMVQNESWTPFPNDNYPFCQNNIVPVLGGFYVGQRRLSNKELAKLGLVPIKGFLGRKIYFPYFYIKGKRSVIDIEPIPCLQFKGVGCQYDGRLTSQRTWARTPALLGRFGIFLDQIHQPYPMTPDPIGAITEYETGAIAKDELLKSYGAVLAVQNVSSIRLLKESDIHSVLGLTSYSSGDLHVTCQELLTETRRLTFLHDEDYYREYIEEVYGDDFDTGRQQHLTELFDNMARNIKAILLAKIAYKKEIYDEKLKPNSASNLDPTGALFDTADLIETQNWEIIKKTVYLWLEDILEVVKASGLDPKEVILYSGTIQKMFFTIFGKDYEPRRINGPLHTYSQFDLPWEQIIGILSDQIVDNWKEFID